MRGRHHRISALGSPATSARPIWTTDASAIHRLAHDSDSNALIAGWKAGFLLRLTFTSVSEIISTENPEQRRKLFGVCRLLLSEGDGIDPQHEIIEKVVARFEMVPIFDWREVSVGFPAVQDEIARRENFSDVDASREHEEQEKLKNQFAEMYQSAKPALDQVFGNGTENIPRSVRDLIALFQGPGGWFWTLAGTLYSRVGKVPPDENLMRVFASECDPFNAFMIAFFAAQYDLCHRPERVGPSFRSGRNDTVMAICLPYCNQFVTNDKGQLACYKQIASRAGLDVTECSYDDFRRGFSVIGATAAGARYSETAS